MKGKTILLVLISILLFGSTANAENKKIENQEQAMAIGGEIFAETSYSFADVTYDYEWLTGGLDGFSDDYDVYPVYLTNKDDIYLQDGKIVALFFVSDTKKTSKLSYRNLISHDGVADYYSLGEVELHFDADVETLWNGYDYPSSNIDWNSYLGQFLGKDGTIEDIKKQLSGKYFEMWMGPTTEAYGTGWENGNRMIKLEAGTETVEDTIVTMRTDTTQANIYYCAPFLYIPPGETEDFTDGDEDNDDDDGGKDKDKLPTLKIKTKAGTYFSGIRQVYRWDFSWNYEDYDIYQKSPNDYYIEFRYKPGKNIVLNLLRKSIVPHPDKEYTYKYNISSKYCISKNVVSGYEKDLLDKYYNFFTSMVGRYYVFELRVVSEDGRASNWVRIGVDSHGVVHNISDTDDEGEVEEEQYIHGDDEDTEEHIAGEDDMTDNEDPKAKDSDDIFGNIKLFFGNLTSALSAIGNFPQLLAKVFPAMPSALIGLLWASFAIIVIVRILAR